MMLMVNPMVSKVQWQLCDVSSAESQAFSSFSGTWDNAGVEGEHGQRLHRTHAAAAFDDQEVHGWTDDEIAGDEGWTAHQVQQPAGPLTRPQLQIVDDEVEQDGGKGNGEQQQQPGQPHDSQPAGALPQGGEAHPYQ